MPLAVLLVILAQVPVDDLITKALAGDGKAVEALHGRSAETLPKLAVARLDPKRGSPALLDLYFRLKCRSWGDAPEAGHLRDKLAGIKTQAEITTRTLTEGLGILREISGLNLVLDTLEKADREVELKVHDLALHRALDTLLIPAGLDYTWRYGVIWIARPSRIWPALTQALPKPPPLTAQQEQAARRAISRLAAESPEEREQAAAELKKLNASVIPLLEQGRRAADPETSATCAALIVALTPRDPWPVPPATNDLRSGRDGGPEGLRVHRKLETLRMEMAGLVDLELPALLELLAEYSAVTFLIDRKTIPEPERVRVSLSLRDLLFKHVLELATLPAGLDARVDENVIVIFARK